MLQRTLKMTPRWLDLGWIGLDTPFLLSLSLLQQRDVLSGKWIVGAVMNVITHPSGPKSQGWKAPTKYCFLSKYFFQLTSWPRPSKWQGCQDGALNIALVILRGFNKVVRLGHGLNERWASTRRLWTKVRDHHQFPRQILQYIGVPQCNSYCNYIEEPKNQR